MRRVAPMRNSLIVVGEIVHVSEKAKFPISVGIGTAAGFSNSQA